VIIQLEGLAAGDLDAAQRSLAALARRWGYETGQARAETETTATRNDEDSKAVDPVSVVAAVTVRILSQGRPVELRTLSPDQLLDLLAGEDPASPGQ
jgi:hypothetical protein